MKSVAEGDTDVAGCDNEVVIGIYEFGFAGNVIEFVMSDLVADLSDGSAVFFLSDEVSSVNSELS